MSYINAKIDALILDVENASRFNLVEYKLLVSLEPVSLNKTLRSNVQHTSTAGGNLKSFQEKLLTTYGL